MKNDFLRFLWPVFLLLGISSCSNEEIDQGGDHLPELRNFDNVAFSKFARPESAVKSQEVTSKTLRRFIHVAEHVTVCLESGFFAAEIQMGLQSVSSLQDNLRLSNLSAQRFGLEGILDQMILRVGQVVAGQKPFSKRIEIEIVEAASKSPLQVCDLLVDTKEVGKFPLNDPSVADVYPSLFYKNQLRDAQGNVNGIPIAYLDGHIEGPFEGEHHVTTSHSELYLQLQRMIAYYLGLPESSDERSPLNRSSKEAFTWPVLAYLTESRVTPEVLSFGAYIALLEGIVGAEDLSQAQYYLDEIGGSEPQTDPEFTSLTDAKPITRKRKPGESQIYSAVIWSGTLKTCVVNQSGKSEIDSRVAEFLSPYTQNFSQTAGRLANGITREEASEGDLFLAMKSLGLSLEGFGSGLELVNSACQLVIQFRNKYQFPFAGRSLNGRFALENKIKDAAGNLVPVPVIYLNVSHLGLAFDRGSLEKKDKTLESVFKHEFAHFLGFKHSRSTLSLLYPGGFNTSWDLSGSDGEALQSYAEIQREMLESNTNEPD